MVIKKYGLNMNREFVKQILRRFAISNLFHQDGLREISYST